MPYKIGSFNLIPSFTVMTLAIAGVGALPWGLRYLFDGEAPRIKDDFEKYVDQQQYWTSGNPYVKNLKADKVQDAKLQ